MDNKRLTKSENKKLGGVCAGIAEYFGCDTTLVRVLWVICVLFAGFGVILYIVLWIVMPAANKKSYTERMQERLDSSKKEE